MLLVPEFISCFSPAYEFSKVLCSPAIEHWSKRSRL